MLTSPLYAKKASGNPDALFSSEQGKLIRSSVFRNATHRIGEDLFLKETRITCSIRQDQTWRGKNFMSSPSTSASVNYNDKRKGKDWRYRTHHTDLLNSSTTRRIVHERKSSSKYSNPKYARNGRN